MGYLEFELCKTFGWTPDELGERRRRNPDGIRFLEYSIIHRWEKEIEARKKAERQARSSRAKHRRK